MATAKRVLCLCLMWIAASIADAQATPAARGVLCAQALLQAADADPLEFARVVNRFGDALVLPLLERGVSGPVRLAAIRASRWLVAPERALPMLAALVSEPDSLLAPAAARAVVEIARGLDRDGLARREAASTELAAALSSLRQASEKPHVRSELRMMAARAAALLEAAGVPSTEAPRSP